MFVQQRSVTPAERARVVVVALVLALTALPSLALPLAAQESSPEASPAPTATEAACSSADDLRLIVDFVQSSVEADRGLVPVLVGAIAGLSEARNLAGLVGDVYRPLVEDLVASFEDLRATLDGLGDLDTAGAKVASIGEAITDIGMAMDSLGVQLRTRCTDEEQPEQ